MFGFMWDHIRVDPILSEMSAVENKEHCNT